MPHFRIRQHRDRRQLLPWLVCAVLLGLLADQYARSGTLTRLMSLGAPVWAGGSGRVQAVGNRRGMAAGSRALPVLVASVNETRFPPEDWWDFQQRTPKQPHPRCAILKCDFRLDCTFDDRSCCTYWLRGLLEFSAAFFETHGLQWLVTYGTLLGAVRDQSLIPWTYDLDIGLPLESWNMLTLEDSRQLRREAWRYGFMVHAGQRTSATRICYHPGHPDVAPAPEVPLEEVLQMPWDTLPRVYADMYAMAPLKEKGENQYRFAVGGDHLQALSAAFTARYTIDGLSVPGPDNATACLLAWYGDDYMTPKVTY